MKNLFFVHLIVLTIIFSNAAYAQDTQVDPPDIGPAHSGSWFNPQQDGHGFSMEFSELEEIGPVAVIYWYTYDAQGHPIFLIGTGMPAENQVEVVFESPTGMVYGDFDSTTVERLDGGSGFFEFSDRENATFSYSPSPVMGTTYGHNQGVTEVPLVKLIGLDAAMQFTSSIISSSTAGVLCDYVDVTYNDQPSLKLTSEAKWSCDGGERRIVANGIPDHEVGTFPNPGNPNVISEQNVDEYFSLTPEQSSEYSELGGPRGPVGYVLNGVKIDAATAGSCDDSGNNCSLVGGVGSWHIEALGQNHFDFGEDGNNAHVQPDGAYHYHGMPEGFLQKLGESGANMTLIGWAVDGFPIYARWGYSNPDDPNSAIREMEGSYQLISSVSGDRPSVNMYALGTFAEDWEYVSGSGDLDQCNGRFGVTPEFPNGIYHYFATDSYPYFQRCVGGLL